MKLLSKLIARGLGLKNYLKLVSGVFLTLYKLGLLKGKKAFDNHYFVTHLVQPGDYVIDIGANLGYFAYIFAKNAGPTGKVYCVEPIGLYSQVLAANTKGFNNIEILPYALGKEDGKEITMTVPQTEKYFSHGRTQIKEEEEDQPSIKEFTATMRNPGELFRDLKKLDYLKCDIEGHEVVVMEELQPLLKEFKPIIQIETGGTNRKKIMELLLALDYETYYVKGTTLIPLSSPDQPSASDLFFIPGERKSRVPEWAFVQS